MCARGAPAAEAEAPRECGRSERLSPCGILPAAVRERTAPRFHCASGFSECSQRLAHMLDSLVRVSRRVGKASEAEAPLTGVGLRPRTPGTSSRRGPGPWRKPRHHLPPSRRACPPGRTLALRGSGPSPRGLPSGAGRDIRGPGNRRSARKRGGSLGLIPGLRPLPNGSRRPTRGEKCTSPRPDLRPRCHRLRPGSRLATRPAAGSILGTDDGTGRADGIESPPFDLSDLSRLPLNGFTYC